MSKAVGRVDEQYAEGGEPGDGGLLGLGGGPWEGHTFNIADPFTFKSSLVG